MPTRGSRIFPFVTRFSSMHLPRRPPAQAGLGKDYPDDEEGTAVRALLFAVGKHVAQFACCRLAHTPADG